MKNEKTLLSEWSRKTPIYIEPTDRQYAEQLKQLEERGFSDSETWALDTIISQFILPRLKRFKELNNGYPFNIAPEKWDLMIDEMIFAFEWSLTYDDDKYDTLTPSEKEANWTRYQAGMRVFADNFRHLWW